MKSKEPVTLSLWFDKLTMIGPDPFALSLSKGKLSMNGLCVQHWLKESHERIGLLNYGLIRKSEVLWRREPRFAADPQVQVAPFTSPETPWK